MADTISTLSILIIGGILIILALAYSLRSSFFPVWSILILFSFDAFLLKGLPFISLGRFNIHPLDLLSVIFVLSAMSRLLPASGRINKYILPAMTLGALLVISLMRGVNLFGIELAVNSFRTYLFFFASLLAIATIKTEHLVSMRFIYWWGIVAWVLFGLALWRWGLVALGLSQNPNWISSGGTMTRVLTAAQTFFLLQTVVFAWMYRKQKGTLPLQHLVPYVIIPAIILLQQRTVWITSLFLLLCIFVFMRQIRPAFLFTILTIGLLGIMALLVLWGNPLLDSLAGSALNMRNFEWRVAGWIALLSPDRFQNVIDYAIGQPFGTGYERYLFGSSYAIAYSPHNFYVQTFLNIGGLGLFILLMIYFGTLKSLLINRQNRQKLTFALILISQLLFFMTYAPSYEQGIMLGFAILLARPKNQLSAVP
jgi:hypothetical protein